MYEMGVSVGEAMSDIRHEMHGRLFSVDVAVGSLAGAQNASERAELASAIRNEVQRIHELVRQATLERPGEAGTELVHARSRRG